MKYRLLLALCAAALLPACRTSYDNHEDVERTYRPNDLSITNDTTSGRHATQERGAVRSYPSY